MDKIVDSLVAGFAHMKTTEGDVTQYKSGIAVVLRWEETSENDCKRVTTEFTRRGYNVYEIVMKAALFTDREGTGDLKGHRVKRAVSFAGEVMTVTGIGLLDSRNGSDQRTQIVIYYSGHGVNSESRYFFSPTAKLDKVGLDFSVFLERLAVSQSSDYMWLLDACSSESAYRGNPDDENYHIFLCAALANEPAAKDEFTPKLLTKLSSTNQPVAIATLLEYLQVAVGDVQQVNSDYIGSQRAVGAYILGSGGVEKPSKAFQGTLQFTIPETVDTNVVKSALDKMKSIGAELGEQVTWGETQKIVTASTQVTVQCSSFWLGGMLQILGAKKVKSIQHWKTK